MLNKDDFTNNKSDELRSLRHTASHVLAQAVKHLYSDVKLAIGPATDVGFYYDFDAGHRFDERDLLEISHHMAEIISNDISI